MGFSAGGASFVSGGRVTNYSDADGFPVSLVRCFARDPAGAIWAAGVGGLSLLRGGRFHTIQTADAPGFTSVSGIVAVPNGGFWLTTGSGIAHIPDGEIENAIQQPEHKVVFELFDLVSDLPEPLQRGQVYSPGAVQASDGTIWFATQKGAVRVDPTHIYRNPLPPPVSIRSIVADEKSYSPFSNAALPALTKNLRIEYAALSLSTPERVRFRYKLEGFDNAWHEAGNRREVFCTNLGPAKYSIRLIACNNDGVWNELGTTLNLSGAPAWFQTTWFRAFCAGVVLLLACILYQWRVRQLHRQQKELRDVIDTVPANVWSTSPDGAVDFVNRRSLEYLHVPAANLLGWNWEAAVHPDDLARFVSHWRAALKRGEPMEHEVRLRRGDGAYRWWITRNVPLRDKSGNIVKWYGSGFDIEDRKRAQETLRDQADLLNLTNDAIFVRDMDLIIKYWNRGAEMLYGWTAAQAEGKSSLELLKTEFPEPIEQIKAELLSQGRWEGELVRLTKEGTRVVVSSRWSLQRDEHGAPIGILETNNDITDRKRAESLLAGEKRILEMVASEDSLGEILSALCQLVEEHASDALASILLLEGDRLRHGGAAGLPKAYADAIDGAPIGPSAASCGTAAYRREQVIVADIATDPLWANYRDLALSHGLRACWSTPIFSPQRKVIATFALYYREPRSPRQRDQEIIGQITHLASVAIERKLTQEALRRNEAYLAEAQRVAHVGSWVWEVDGGNHLHLSEEGYRLVGFDLHASGLTWEQRMHRVHPEDRARWQAGIERAIAEKSDYDLEFRILLPSGAVRYIRSVGHPVLDSSGKLVQFIGVSMDLTERRRGEEERERLRQELTHLAHLNRVSTLGELTASLAHEIRQPITAAVTNARTSLRWLQREPPEIQEACEAAIRVVSDVNRAADIINHLRSLYQKGSVERELVDVNEVAREMLALLSSEAQRYSISMRTELAAELPKIQADRVQLQQVFMNLMVNSIEAMKDTGGELTIRSERGANGEVLISIKDTGVGLPTENVGQIFSAFYTTKSHGTGMGLSISRTIIESHGGRLWASGGKGQGATFQFTLPAAAESSSPAG